jgi:hypothetical protein
MTMEKEAEQSAEPVECLHQYLASVVQKETAFSVFRKPISASSRVDQAKQYLCRYSPEDDGVLTMRLKVDDKVDVTPCCMIDKIQWGPPHAFNYFVVAFKNHERPPEFLHCGKEDMELWYDGLRWLIFSYPAETESSQLKLQLFKRAKEFSKVKQDESVEFPPPPGNFDFCAAFDD